jgi:hypothetical protein
MKFITYFDYLGFGDFIRNNELDYQRKIMANIFRDIESALAKGKLIDAKHGVIADLTHSKVHCINFSDTVVFWTNDISVESVAELLHITHIFNWQANLFFFPVRGTMTMGELERVEFSQKSGLGGSYNINSVYGKGLVTAHEIAENQKWAGTLLDENVEEFIIANLDNSKDVLEIYTKPFNVPFKTGIKNMKVFNLIKGELNDIAFANYSKGIIDNFANHKKGIENHSVKEKIDNTINFLASYRNFKPS